MTDVGVEAAGVAGTNGGTDPLGLEPKATVLAKDDSASGKLALTGPGHVLGNFSGQIDCGGDLLGRPDAHGEAANRGVRVTLAGLLRGNVIARRRPKITSSGRLEAEAT